MATNTYEGGLAQQSTKHFYAGSMSSPKRQTMKKKKKCKKSKTKY